MIPELRRALLRLSTLLRSGRAETELGREIQSHLRLLEDEYVARGMSAEEARFAARRAFGGVEQAKERQRDVRAFRALAGWPLDLKLGARMLVKSPGLTVVAVLALSVAIGGGAAYVEFLNDLIHPRLNVDGGDRIVGIVNWDPVKGAADHRALRDFTTWRRSATSIEHLGAWRSLERNLITDDGRAEPVRGVEISPSAFGLIPTPPLVGRPLVEADEAPAAPPVAVIGESLWQARFGGDPSIVGRTVRIGRTRHTVVGVMPKSFGFPVNQSLWIPFRAEAAAVHRDGEPPIRMFGRLAAGVPPEAAEAELTSLAADGHGTAATPDLRPEVRFYVRSFLYAMSDGGTQVVILYSVNVLFLGLLAICGANVATLVFARTATRENEITVRTALGATRGRIVAQLFAEALVLSSVATLVGLLAAAYGLRWVKSTWEAAQGAPVPFWWDDALSIETVVYAIALTLLAALIVSVVPALRATGPEMQVRLKQAGATGSSMKFGSIWTGVVICQVAVTVVFLMSVMSLGWNVSVDRLGPQLAVAGERILTARLEAGDEATGSTNRAATAAELERRILAEPGVVGVTYSTHLPGAKQEEFWIELEGRPTPPGEDDVPWAKTAAVATSFFDTFGASLVSGRTFTQGDVDQRRHVAIVDETFVRFFYGGADPVGQRVRQPRTEVSDTPGPWYEIVGVVSDLAAGSKRQHDGMLYRPLSMNDPAPLYIAVRAAGDARRLTDRFRSVAADTDPTLRIYDVRSLDQVNEADRLAGTFFLRALAIVAAVALLLSTAGIYALLAFTLARRRREIGIRAALGAVPRRIVATLFSRAFMQVGAGIALGLVPGAAIVAGGAPEIAGGRGGTVALLASLGVASFVLAVALGACIVPARRALRIDPTEALRADS